MTTEQTNIEVPQGAARTLDRNIRLNPTKPLPAAGGVTEQRIRAMIATACKLLIEGPPETPGLLHRLDKADTRHGLRASSRSLTSACPMPWCFTSDFSAGPLPGTGIQCRSWSGMWSKQPLKRCLQPARAAFARPSAPSAVNGFDQAPDFIVPSEFSPKVIIEAKLTEDDGTARDKVTRVQHLGALATKDKLPHEASHFEVIACIAGRGFKVRREDMKKLLIATRGKVFTLETITQMVEHSLLKEFVTS